MSTRAEAAASALEWAEAAERHAHIYIDARSRELPAVEEAAFELGSHSQAMALMWAAVAAVQPEGEDFAEALVQQLAGAHREEADHV